jgi:hypothetical protein
VNSFAGGFYFASFRKNFTGIRALDASGKPF